MGDFAADVVAHRAVISAARERQEALRSLATLSANAEEATDKTGAQAELETKIAQLQEEYTGAAYAAGPGGCTPLLLVCMQDSADDVAALLALGADPAIEGEVSSISGLDEKYKCTPLMLAARDGRMAIVKVLLAHVQVDVNQASSDTGRTALFSACFSGHAAVVKLLLAQDGIDANMARMHDGITPLYMACGKGHGAIAKLLLAHAGIDVNKATTDYGTTPLFAACQEGHTEIVKLLLAHAGINANKAIADDGTTPLLVACQEGHSELVELLLAHGGIDTNKASKNGGLTPLYMASIQGHTAIVKGLLAHAGIDVNKARTDTGETPLKVACFSGHTAVVELMLAHAGVDANKAAADGVTPLFAACQEDHAAVVTLMLAHGGIDVNQARTDTGSTPLYMACQEGHAAVVKLLLAHAGIDANKARTDVGATPLHLACLIGNVEIIKLLLSYEEIDVNNAMTDRRFTPLHGAAIGGARLAMQHLVLHGASLVAEDSEGLTAAQRASSQNESGLTEWLSAVSGWSQLRVAAGCRLYKEAAFLLRLGKIDPDDPATTSIKEIMAVVATSTTKPAALMWRDAPQICKATTKLVADATRGWHRTTHWLHHKVVRDVVFAVVVVAGRLEKKDALLAAASSDAGVDAGMAESTTEIMPVLPIEEIPLLPIELWLFAMRFFMRSWWEIRPL